MELATAASQTDEMPSFKEHSVAILRIELEGIKPLIWRRVALPTSMNLTDVHGVIQVTMGWLDCHLWEFEAEGRKHSRLILDDPQWNDRITDAATTKLSALLSDRTPDISYVYDMGDGWQHRIVVEKIMPADPKMLYPQFLGGERRCPPEDCGGVPGYYEFIASKESKKRKVALAWYGRPYDPDDIGEDQIVGALKRIASPV